MRVKLPIIEGIIRRRILVNFRVNADVMHAQLPERFTPKLHDGSAMVGICLIRLEQIRPDWEGTGTLWIITPSRVPFSTEASGTMAVQVAPR